MDVHLLRVRNNEAYYMGILMTNDTSEAGLLALAERIEAQCSGVGPGYNVPITARPWLWKKVVDAARLAATVSAGVGGWQPIKTAPKDGTQILAYLAQSETDCAHCTDIAVWHDGKWADPENVDETEYAPPTHWMPLPAPPGAQGKQGSAGIDGARMTEAALTRGRAEGDE